MSDHGHPDGHPTGAPEVDGTAPYTCPRCGERDLIRVHRRFIDRLLSVFVRLRRFRCAQFQCQWEGNLRTRTRSRGGNGPE